MSFDDYRSPLIEALEPRMLLAVAYDWIGSATSTPAPSPPYVLTGNAGDRHMIEPGVSAIPPVSGYIDGLGSGQTTSFTLSNLFEHQELKLTIGVRGKQTYPVGGGGPEEEDPPPEGVWKFEVWFDDYYRWWYTDGSGAGGAPWAFVHHEDSFNVTVKGTWLSSGPAPGWYLESAKVERFTPEVFIYPVDTAVEGTTSYPGGAPGFVVSRSGDNLLGALEVDLSAPGGTAQQSIDYTVLPDTVTIPATHTKQLTVAWKALASSPLDSNPHMNGGRRIFPDRLTPAETFNRDLVNVKVTVRPVPPSGTLVHVRSFDVDDPNVDADLTLDPNDDPEVDGTRLPIGGDNRGTPRRGSFIDGAGTDYGAGTAAPINSAGSATFSFRVTGQPGDNFRVAAAMTDADLDQLTTWSDDHPNGMYYVGATNNPLPAPAIGLTDMLTVWRRLWVERDQMGGVTPLAETLSLHGAESGFTFPGFPATPFIRLLVNFPNPDVLEGGSVFIPAFGVTATIYRNRVGSGIDDILIDNSALTAAQIAAINAVGMNNPLAAIVNDDDQIPAGGVHPLADGGALLTSAFGEAYIKPIYVDSASLNPRRVVDFERHLEDTLTSVTWANRDLDSQARFWATLLVSAHENWPHTDGDGDGDRTPRPDFRPYPDPLTDSEFDYGYSGPQGLFYPDQNVSAIFMETLRDRGPLANLMLSEVVTHELGHTAGGGLGHTATGLLMADYSGQTSFDNATQAAFRSVITW